MRVVVVLPLVPVIAAIGMRVGEPGGNSMSITGPAASRGVPSEGATVHAKAGGGVDLADGTAGLAVGAGDVGGQKIDAGDVEADGQGRPLRHLAVVRVDQIGDVDRRAAGRQVAGRTQVDGFSGRRHALAVVAFLFEQSHGLVVELEAGEHLFVADAAARIAVDPIHQLLDGR